MAWPTVADLRGTALGEMGMTRREFYEMPVGEFLEALAAYRRKEAAERRHAGELARGAALRLFNIQLRRKDQIRRPSEFWPMPWDGDEVEVSPASEKRSPQAEKENRRSLARLVGRLNGKN